MFYIERSFYKYFNNITLLNLKEVKMKSESTKLIKELAVFINTVSNSGRLSAEIKQSNLPRNPEHEIRVIKSIEKANDESRICMICGDLDGWHRNGCRGKIK